uniref:Uncharacterized protein LOC108043548 n=1 Tax=Drosophila rhopaloa TaxID=1041015 RepID=A0A6P4EXG7_DRORH
MLRLQSKTDDKQSAVFLNHRKLINEAYGEFQLKSELFQFQAKKTPQENGGKQSKKRKRNAGDGGTSSSEDLHMVNGYLELLAKPNAPADTPPIARHWEDAYIVPQLYGANESGRMQKFQSQDDAPSVYLIPNRCKFFNHNVDNLTALLHQLLPAYDLIVLDPPWRNKYIRRLKRAKQELGYSMLSNDQLSQLIAPPLADLTQKQPYEMLYVACRSDAREDYGKDILNTDLLLSVPSIVHSHKPPLLSWLRDYMQLEDDQMEPKCLELFARYLQPNFTSIGLEVLKLMDERLYEVGQEGNHSKLENT